MKNILITKNFDYSHPLIEGLENSGYKVMVEPLFKVEPIAHNIDNSADVKNIIITSANCRDFLSGANLNKDIRIFAIGRQTAQMAARIGFSNIEIANQKSAVNLKNLFTGLAKNKSDLTLYPRGEIITMDLKSELENLGYNIDEKIVYRTIEKDSFSQNLLDFCQNSQINQIAIYSQNSAKIFIDLAIRHSLIKHFSESRILCFSKKIISFLKASCDKSWVRNIDSFDQIKILKEFYE